MNHTKTVNNRDDFPPSVKANLAKRVGQRCSKCRRLTSGPHSDKNKATNLGTAAHITAAAPGGPRYNEKLTVEQRKDIDNGIWLCNFCADLIDKDEKKYTEILLRELKQAAEKRADDELNGIVTIETQSIVTKEINTIEEKEILSSEHKEIGTPSSGGKITQIHRLLESLDSNITEDIESEYHAELDQSKALLEKYEPVQAIEYLSQIQERVWSKSGDRVKFRILTNLATAEISIGRTNEALRLFLEALQYNRSDEKALTNCSLGYLLTEDNDKAREYADYALRINPQNIRAISYKIQSLPPERTFKEIIKLIPKELIDQPEINLSLGLHAVKQSKYKDAIKYFENAIKNDASNEPNLHEWLGNTILMELSQDELLMQSIQIDENAIKQLNTAIEELSAAWDIIKDTGIKKYKQSILINRSIAKKVIGNINGAISDMNLLLDMYPKDITYLKRKAVLEILNSNFTEAIKILEPIKNQKEFNDGYILLEEALKKTGQLNEAINVLTEGISNSSEQKVIDEAKRELIGIYLSKGTDNLDEAKKLASELKQSDPEDILNIIPLARIALFSEETSQAINILISAKKLISKKTPIRAKYELANIFYELKQYFEAADTYKTFVNTGILSPLTIRLANCYYLSNHNAPVIRLCNKLKKTYNDLGELSLIGIAAYQNIGNFKKAKDIAQTYLHRHPEDLEIEIQLATINHAIGEDHEVDRFLSSNVDLTLLSLQSLLKLTFLYSERAMNERMLYTSYEMRRRYYADPDAHLKYIGFFMNRDKSIDLTPNIISVDSVVTIEDKSHHKSTYTIEDRKDPKLEQREINLNHKLSQILLGKQLNDNIVINENGYEQEYKIVEISNKYVYAYQESLINFNSYFPSTLGITKIPFEEGNTESESAGKEEILKVIDKQDEYIQQVIDEYKAGHITIGMVARSLNSSLVEAWGSLLTTPNLGIRSALGTDIERNEANKLFEEKHALVVDLVALLTLDVLNIKDVTVKFFGKLNVSQSTVDEISQQIREWTTFKDGYMTIGVFNGQHYSQEVTSQAIRKDIEKLESLKNWIRNNCNILAIDAEIEEKWNKKDLKQIIGSSSYDSLILASSSNKILYSDDFFLRSLAKNDFDVKGIWIQPILNKLLKEGLITKDEYQKHIIKLICINYAYISIDAEILLMAAKEANWLPETPFTNVVSLLNGTFTDEDTTIVVLTYFLYLLYKESILPYQRDSLVQLTIRTALMNRDIETFIPKLKAFIDYKFQVIQNAKDEINNFLDNLLKAKTNPLIT